MAIINIKPINPPTVLVNTMALGAATAALEHSSARWKGESYPDIAQITPIKLIKNDNPVGHSA